MRIDQLIEGLNLETYDSEFKARIRTGRDKKGEDEEIKWLREVHLPFIIWSDATFKYFRIMLRLPFISALMIKRTKSSH